MTKIAGSGYGSEFGSGSISQRHESADPDPHQNVMDDRNTASMSLIFLQLGDDHVPVQVGEVLAPDVVGLLLGQPQHTLHLCHSEIYRDNLMRSKENYTTSVESHYI